MSKNAKLRLVTGEPQPDPRALSSLDWIALGLLSVVLVLAPLVAATFATPPQSPVFALAELTDYVTALGTPLLIALTAVACLITAWREWKRPVAIGGIRNLSGAAGVLGLWAVVSLIRTPVMGQSLNALAVLLSSLIAAVLISRLSRDQKGFTTLLLSLVIGGTLLAGIGVNEFLGKWKSGDPQLRSFGTFFNPNFLAGYLLLTLPVTLSAFATTQERLLTLILGIGVALQSACLLLTASRAGAAMGIAALVVWLLLSAYANALKQNLKQIGIGLLIFLVSAGLASAPTLGRIAHSAEVNSGSVAQSTPTDTQSHSGAYRRLTWTGTMRMVTANPIIGTGIGSYDVTYPQYTLAAPTAHAHNSFLQWAGETGFPGLLALLAALAASTAFAAYVLRLQLLRKQRKEADEVDSALYPDANELALQDRASVLLAGLFAALFGSMLHSLFDSDWYLVCTVFALSAVTALLVAQARDIAPLATLRPAPLSLPALGIGSLFAVFLLWRAGAMGLSRYAQTEGRSALYQALNATRTGSGDPATAMSQAKNAFASAVSADPLDAEAHLQLAQTNQFLGDKASAQKELESAASVARTGKTFYRLGRFYAQNGDMEKALHAFEQARKAEPKNLQNLRQLAETLVKTNQDKAAALIYQLMTELQKEPYGQVRAIPEMVEIDFGYAHLGLADIAHRANDTKQAAVEYGSAAKVFREYWDRRKYPENQQRIQGNIERHKETISDYERTLNQWIESLQKIGDTATLTEAKSQQERFQKEQAEDKAAESKTESNSPTP